MPRRKALKIGDICPAGHHIDASNVVVETVFGYTSVICLACRRAKKNAMLKDYRARKRLAGKIHSKNNLCYRGHVLPDGIKPEGCLECKRLRDKESRCINGHEWDSTTVGFKKSGQVYCRECNRIRVREYNARISQKRSRDTLVSQEQDALLLSTEVLLGSAKIPEPLKLTPEQGLASDAVNDAVDENGLPPCTSDPDAYTNFLGEREDGSWGNIRTAPNAKQAQEMCAGCPFAIALACGKFAESLKSSGIVADGSYWVSGRRQK